MPRDDDVCSSVTLDSVVADPHLHALFLQHLSTSNKKGFARLLFLVSVEEFKKVLASPAVCDEAVADAQVHRCQYASKIITKFMSPDAFLDIASENLRILNKSVASFGKLLRNDLMLYNSLAAKTDLFQDAEDAVKKVLQPLFQQFAAAPEFAALVASSHLTYVGADELDSSSGDAEPLQQQQVEGEGSPRSLSNKSLTSPAASTASTRTQHTHGRRQRTATTFLTLERVLGNRRLCSVFWVFLFKERTHQQLSLWMDFRYQLLPVLEDFVHVVQADADRVDEKQRDKEQSDDTEDQQAGELIEQLLAGGSRIAAKYLIVNASTRVTFVGEAEQALLHDYEVQVACCLESGSFSLADAEELHRTVERIQGVIEADLKVNHFVRFMGSESFKSLVASYQSRLLSPSGSPDVLTSTACDGSSTASDSSMTTLQELFQCMNVPSHQPQRVRSKSFTLRDLYQGQLRGELQSKSLISSVMSFRLDVNDRSHPGIIKEVLHTLAGSSNRSESCSDLYHHHAIPDHVEAFFRPSGADVVRSTVRPKPSLFHMTIGNSDKAFYGACLTRYVPLNDSSKLGPLEQVLQETEGLEVYVPAGICIISRYPILDTLKQRLDLLHTAMQDDESYLSDVNWLPSVAQVGGLLCPLNFSTMISPDDGTSILALDDFVDFSMEEIFSCLSVEHVVALVTCMLLERQIVLVSSRYSVLTAVGETLKSLIAPLEWSHVFAPILPKSMLECLQCPTPYLFGVHASYRGELREMLEREGCGDSIVVVDLDADKMSAPGRPQLPESIRGPLTSRLLQLLKPRVYYSDFVPMVTKNDTVASTSQCFPQGHVRMFFREAIAALLRTVEEFRFVLSDDFDYVVVFDRIAFVRHLPSREQSFYRSFLETQVFSHEIASVSI
uniref:UDENN domain-containing protein n=1 Tax=Hyaloperonospora arabidopsidis (strain Emoy2) TaxID=559515 RepID=M4BMN9_HYAAE